mmetsp:Transcript_25237/g.35245  ORF Transcript_25237/g.35245 Transcript_25237/m.35245 type:complete len:93 (-) Transcript_25237:428-706(-)
MPTHGGEVSFPGGSEELGDKSIIDTALRETYEEMGIERNRIKVLGQMGEFPSKHRIGVTAVVSKDTDRFRIFFHHHVFQYETLTAQVRIVIL